MKSTVPNFFSDGSPYLNHPLLTPERTSREVDFVLSQLQPLPDARILDVGCGFGRHSIELSRRGFSVVGIDPSQAMIEAAQATAMREQSTVAFHQAAGEHYTSDYPFEIVLCLFTTLGQITTPGQIGTSLDTVSEGGSGASNMSLSSSEDNSRMLTNLHTLLQPGGHLLIEVPQKGAYVSGLKTEERFGDDQNFTEIRRRFDVASSTVTEQFTIGTEGRLRDYLLQFRLYSREELTELLTNVGLQAKDWFANVEGETLTESSPMMLVMSQS